VPAALGARTQPVAHERDAMKSAEKEKGDPPNQGDSIILEARRGAGQPKI